MSAAQEWTPAAVELQALIDQKIVERELEKARQQRAEMWNADCVARQRAEQLRAHIAWLIPASFAVAIGGISVLTRPIGDTVEAYGYATWLDAALELSGYGDGVRVSVSAPWGSSSHLCYQAPAPAGATLLDVLADVEQLRRRWRAELDEHAACMADVTRGVNGARAAYAYVTLAPPAPLWRWQWTGPGGEPCYGWSHTGTLDGDGEALLWRDHGHHIGNLSIWQIGRASPSAELYAYADMLELTRARPDLCEQIMIDVPGIGFARLGGPGDVPWRVELDERAPALSMPSLRLYAAPDRVLRVEALRRPCWYVRFLNDYAIESSMRADEVAQYARDFLSAPAALVSDEGAR